MKLSRILMETGASRVYGTGDPEITGVCFDSRKIAPGDLYICIPGTRVDGHRFAADAAAAGAAALMVDHVLENVELPQILLDDTRLGMTRACAALAGHPERSMVFAAVTGTNGKTTTTHIMKTVLETAGFKVGMMGTVANYIGDEVLPQKMTTPDPTDLYPLLARMKDAGCTHVVMEASAHALALRKLEGIHFKTCVFTNLTQDHLDDFHTMENYAAAKALLFEDVRCETAVMCGDDPSWKTMTGGRTQKTVTYGTGEGTQYRALGAINRLEGISYTLQWGDCAEKIELELGGAFNVLNSLAAACACMEMGLSIRQVRDGLARVHTVPGRIQKVDTGLPFTVVVDYAHTPDGIRSILETLRPITPGRLIVVFGCGGDRDKTKRPIMGEIASRLADFLVLTSDNPRTEDPEAILDMIEPGAAEHDTPRVRIADRYLAIRHAMEWAEAGDVVLIAGKGHENYQEIRGVRFPFDDAVTVKLLAEGMKNELAE